MRMMVVDSESETGTKPQSHRFLPPAVKDEYDKHLEYLKQTCGPQSKPQLYERLQTFWLPQKANYFLLNGTTKPRPSQLYNHRWFYWDPDHLVEGGL